MRMRMLEEVLCKQEKDILLLQEVIHMDFDTIRKYKAPTNVGIHNRGTAMLHREQLTLTIITRLPSGRGMAVCYRGVWIVNTYAPSGTSNRQEMEDFYNVELTYLLRSIPPTMIIGGDFNYVLSQADCTGNRVGYGSDLTDVWETFPLRAIFTHYTPHGAARLDRVHLSPNLRSQKSGVETVLAAFADHLTVCLPITLGAPVL
jgi:endonuclease/exonuclease/phosphatase family metal-dependent hydrolase